ncbi:N-acetylneuraminate synthase [Thalassospira povalilytica]|jgi:N-acetylneuraminate synthase|uniref:N-acetylneuraminate synthase n=1 Tax=Thalassospira povalilytica TaxID=732237 RepID=UPI003AA8237E
MTEDLFVIAEAGVNHNGSINMAIELVDAAVEAGADAVKFQTFRADRLASKNAAKAPYQEKSTDQAESQFDMLKKLELTPEMHDALVKHCAKVGIEFMSTPFDEASARYLVEEVGVKRLKIPSGEITNAPYLLSLARLNVPLIVSTGMSSLEEVKEAVRIIAFGFSHSEGAFDPNWRDDEVLSSFSSRLSLLHCTTEYPAPVSEVNLRAIDQLRDSFPLPIGFSDHTEGIHIPLAAVGRGAVVIEKHFTLDRNLLGPDHKASLEPAELTTMVKCLRDAYLAMGDGDKKPASSEEKNIPIVRKSIVARTQIAVGDLLSAENLAVKRPGTGISPMRWWDVIGTRATRNFDVDELIEL